MDGSWIDIASKFGIPVALLLGLAYVVREVFIKLVWPFVTKQLEEAQAQRKAEIEKFDNTIRTRDALLVQQWQEHLKALDSVTGEVRGLRADLKVKPTQRSVKKR